jgi:uncharacterized protein GlcG (DUF336 family)
VAGRGIEDIMKLKLFALALAALVIAGPSAAQQSAPPPYGAPITLELAKKIVAAAEAEAVRNNWEVAIAILDSGGNMVLLQKLDNTQLVSIKVSEAKARTALGFRLPTKMLEDAIATGGAGTRLLALDNIAPFEGGYPIIEDGKIIGAIGVAGVFSAQDAQIAKAGLAALGNPSR